MLNQESKKKLNKAKHWLWLLKLVPYIRAIFIVGSVGMGKAKKHSDIDFLIITKTRRIFTVRFFLIAITQIFGLRRNGNKIANCFCLNHYLTENALKLPYKNDYDKKAYTTGLQVLYDEDNLYKKFLTVNGFYNRRLSLRQLNNRRLSLRLLFEFVLNGFFGDVLEKILKKLQLKKIASNPKIKESKGIIIVNDKQLQFHPISKSRINAIEIDN